MGRRSSLTEKQWAEIERRLLAGESGRKLAAEFSISEAAIRKRGRQAGWGSVSIPAVDRRAVLHAGPAADESGFLYVIFIDTGIERFYKIGISKNFSARFGHHQCASPFEIKVATCYFVGNASAEERTLHYMYRDKRVRGEWFLLGDDDLKGIAARALLE